MWRRAAAAAISAMGLRRRESKVAAERSKSASSQYLSYSKWNRRIWRIPPGPVKVNSSRSISTEEIGFNAWWINDGVRTHDFRKNSIVDLPQLKDYLAPWPTAISLDHLSETLDIGLEAGFLARVFHADSRFLLVAGQRDECPVVLPKAALFRWFVWLNLKLAATRQFKITEKLVTHFLNNRLLPGGSWVEPPPSIVSWGASLHLIHPSKVDSSHLFPLARMLSWLSNDMLSVAIDVLREFEETRVWDTSLVELRNQSMEEVFAVCPERAVEIVRQREGLLEESTERLTLEEVGRLYGLTRERIRQIEKEFYDLFLLQDVTNIARLKRVRFQWELRCGDKIMPRVGHLDRLKQEISETRIRRRLVSRLIAALLSEFLALGDLTLKAHTPNGNRGEFLARSCSIPVATNDRWQVLGMESDRFRNSLRGPDGTPTRTLKSITETIAWVTAKLEEDGVTGEIRNSVRAKWYRQLAKTEKVRLALKEIGKPAHFSEITETYNSMWLGDYSSERSIHGNLDRATNGIVWVGVKGTYALQEWGYERSELSLFQLASQIARAKFAETNRPVPFTVIAAEIGKHRKLLNPSSLQFAIGLNPELRRVGKDVFVPADEHKEVERAESADIQWEKALDEFENNSLG